MKLARLPLAVCLLAGLPLLPAAVLVDPTGGTVLTDSADDWSSDARSIGFSFNFFGTPQTEIYVNSNGNLTFGAGDGEYINTALTGTMPRIAAFWDDLYMPGGAILETTGPGVYAVTWLAVDTYSFEGQPVTAQAALFGAGNAFGFAPGSIAFSYGLVSTLNEEYDGIDPPGDGDGVTVGLDAGDGVRARFAPGSMNGLFITLADFDANVPSGDSPNYILFSPTGRGGDYAVTIAPGSEVPEPSSVILISSGIALIIVRRRPVLRRG